MAWKGITFFEKIQCNEFSGEGCPARISRFQIVKEMSGEPAERSCGEFRGFG